MRAGAADALAAHAHHCLVCTAVEASAEYDPVEPADVRSRALAQAVERFRETFGRAPDSLLFDSSAWFVYVTAHDRAFGSTKSLPAYLKARPPAPGAELRRRAAALNEDNLATTLGELVDAKGRKAILQRRDALLALPAAASGAAKSP